MEKIKFAQLIAWLARTTGHNFDSYEIREIDGIIAHPADRDAVIEMIASMASGQFITAIKNYRAITGYGLKESKEAIEAAMGRVSA